MTARCMAGPLRLLGSGSALPGPTVSNAELIRWVESHGGSGLASRARAIVRRMGIRSRHVCLDIAGGTIGGDDALAHPRLAATALGRALAEAGRAPADLGYLFGHTTTPHTPLPPNVAWVADEVGYDGPFVELRQACTGFANATLLAAGLLASPGAAPIAIVGSETGSLHFRTDGAPLDDEQLINVLQMGDGAGAVVLGPADGASTGVLRALYFGALGGRRAPGFWLEYGDQGRRFRHDFDGVRTSGLELFRRGVEAAATLGVSLSDVDWVLPHQANGRMAEILAPEIGFPADRIVVDGDVLGNQGSASIWVAFDRLRRSGRLRPGDAVLVLGAEATKYLYGGFLYVH